MIMMETFFFILCYLTELSSCELQIGKQELVRHRVRQISINHHT